VLVASDTNRSIWRLQTPQIQDKDGNTRVSLVLETDKDSDPSRSIDGQLQATASKQISFLCNGTHTVTVYDDESSATTTTVCDSSRKYSSSMVITNTPLIAGQTANLQTISQGFAPDEVYRITWKLGDKSRTDSDGQTTVQLQKE
jgi:hypothetical protein